MAQEQVHVNEPCTGEECLAEACEAEVDLGDDRVGGVHLL